MSQSIIKTIESYKNQLNFVSGADEQEIFKNFYSNIDKATIQAWINSTFTKTSLKDNLKSKQLREKGNINFSKSLIHLALENYTESLSYACYDSENFALALANRSAAFYSLGNYESCVNDIKECLDHGYPDELKYKVYSRLANCFCKLFRYKEASEIVEKLRAVVPENKEGQVAAEIELILTEISGKTDLVLDKSTVLPTFTPNEEFCNASNLIELKYNLVKGRYVVAKGDISSGEILFVEKPFAVVPIANAQACVCYHCFGTTDCPIPCKNCQTNFCSSKCFDSSCGYHRFECAGSCAGVWFDLGVNFLALRTLILGKDSGFQNVFTTKKESENNYDVVCNLISNVDKMDKIDVFPHVVTASMLTMYLEQKTDFFESIKRVATENRENLPFIVGSTVLKHTLQVISNATTIQNVPKNFYAIFNSTEQLNTNGFQFSGVAMYPSVSMMNHSCDSNITNFFIDDVIIVKAKTDISKGSEIFNSYGFDCKSQITRSRKEEIKKQHFFDCTCSGCTFPTRPEIFHEGLRCVICTGLSLPKNDGIYACVDCKHEFNAQNHFNYIKKAESLYEKFEKFNNIDALLKCLRLRENAFHKNNFLIYTTNLDLQTYYGESGSLKLWWLHTQKSLEMDEFIFGENSLKSALNLRLCLLILLRYSTSLTIKEPTISEITLLDLLGHASNMFEKMKKIFFLYYDEQKINFHAIDELVQDSVAIATHILGEKLCNDDSDNENDL